MERSKAMRKLSIPREEYMSPGHLACQGCAAALIMRLVLKALGKKCIFSIPACCWSVIDGPFPYSAIGVPLNHVPFETAASSAAGVAAAMKVLGKEDVTVVAWAGDGGTFDIGIQAISGAAEREDNILYIVYDNEAYMNTGIQRSSATPWKAWTTTTPYKFPKKTPKKNIDAILAAHKIPYLATASPAYPEDLVRKVKKAKEIKGFKFIHIISPCPPGWKTPPEISIKLARLAVQTGIFPLYEVEKGEYYKINVKPKELKPVIEYLKLQGRFRHLTEEDVQEIQRQVERNWKTLLLKEEFSKKLKEISS